MIGCQTWWILLSGTNIFVFWNICFWEMVWSFNFSNFLGKTGAGFCLGLIFSSPPMASLWVLSALWIMTVSQADWWVLSYSWSWAMKRVKMSISTINPFNIWVFPCPWGIPSHVHVMIILWCTLQVLPFSFYAALSSPGLRLLNCSCLGLIKWKWKSLSPVWLFATPFTIQSMEFSRPEYWSG